MTLSCAYYMFDDWRSKKRLEKGNLRTTSGSRHATLNLNASLAYIDKVYNDYIEYGQLDGFQGNISEIGPGDNFGVALKILFGGANSVHTIDRWHSFRDESTMKDIYEALYQKEGYSKLFEGYPSEKTIKNLHAHSGVSAERFFRETNLKFDAIISRAVLEHLYSPLNALDSMATTLRPGGLLIHRIDLRDHGMFSGHHPLTLYTINNIIWRKMTRNSGRPNRFLITDYENWLKQSGIEGELLITRLAGIDSEIKPSKWQSIPKFQRDKALECVASIRKNLSGRYKHTSDQSLAVSGCLLIGKKNNI